MTEKLNSEEIETIIDLNRINSISEEWNKVASNFKTPLLLHEWFITCSETLHQRLSVITYRLGGELQAIAPMTAVRNGGIESLVIMGTDELGEPGGLIYSGVDPLRSIVMALLKKGVPIMLKRIDSKSILRSVLAEVCRGRALCLFKDSANSLWFETNPKWKEFDQDIPSKRLRGLRRKQRIAEKMGKVRYEVVSPSLNLLEGYLNELFKVEDAGWKGKNGTSMLAQPHIKQFMINFAERASHDNSLRLFFMRINEEPVAARMAVIYVNRLWEIKIGYDERFSQCSPGLLLTHETLRYTFEQGLDGYEFLGNEEEWEHLWTDKVHSYISAYIYPYNILGVIALGADIFRSVGKKIMKKIRLIFL